MRLTLFIFLVLIKNFFSVNFYKKDGRFMIKFFIVNFLMLFLLFYLNSFWENNKITEAIPVFICIDFFLLLFLKFLKIYEQLLDFLIKKTGNKIINPFKIILDYQLDIKIFYIIMTIFEILFLFFLFC